MPGPTWTMNASSGVASCTTCGPSFGCPRTKTGLDSVSKPTWPARASASCARAACASSRTRWIRSSGKPTNSGICAIVSREGRCSGATRSGRAASVLAVGFMDRFPPDLAASCRRLVQAKDSGQDPTPAARRGTPHNGQEEEAMASTPARPFHPPSDPRWQALHSEPALEPALEIVDAHHHLFDRPAWPYSLEDLLGDFADGHRIRASVYVQCGEHYLAEGPPQLRPVGETRFVDDAARRSLHTSEGAVHACAA